MKYLKDFGQLNEARKSNKDDIAVLVKDIEKMLTDAPLIKSDNEKYPDQKHAYTLATIKKYMRDKGYTNDQVDQAMYKISNDKEFKDVDAKIKSVNVYFAGFDSKSPVYYIETDMDKHAIVEYYDDLQKEATEKLKNDKKEMVKKAIAEREAKAAEAAKKRKEAATKKAKGETTEKKPRAKRVSRK